MPSYGEFIMPPSVDRPVIETATDVPAGTTCSVCGHPNCLNPGACS